MQTKLEWGPLSPVNNAEEIVSLNAVTLKPGDASRAGQLTVKLHVIYVCDFCIYSETSLLTLFLVKPVIMLLLLYQNYIEIYPYILSIFKMVRKTCHIL